MKNIDSSKIYLENIIERIPYFIFWKSTDLVYLGCNQRFANLIGKKSPVDIIGKTDFELGWGEGEAEAYREGDCAVMNGNSKVNVEEILARPDGSNIVMLVSKVPLRDKYNNCIGILGVSTDITDRKKMEEELRISKELAEAASHAKTLFLENMRHDLRTPLTGIVGFVNILKEEISDKRLSEYMDHLLASTNSLSDLINDILESIRISSGEISLINKKFNIKEKTTQIISFSKKIYKKNIETIVEFNANLPDYIEGDSFRIGRIILELVKNALKFTDEGAVKISLSLLSLGHENLALKLIVKDSGIGIPKEKQAEIFEKFNRLTPSYQGVYKGVGLGLSIVKQFLNELNGEINLNSEVDSGSAFTCIIPIKIAVDSDINEAQKLISKFDIKDKKERFGKVRIMLVEDDELAGRVAKIIFDNMVCDVDLVRTGKEAVAFAAAHDYDIIFLDIGLPDITGYDVTQRIRKNEFLKDRSHVPIIALSAHVDVENQKHGIELGMDVVLRKPLMKHVAQDILRSFVPRFHMQMDLNYARIEDNNKDLFVLVGEYINFNKMIQILGHNKMLAKEMLSIMENSLSEQVVEFKKYYDQEDWKSLKDMSHKLRGSASYCATERLEEACANLENNIICDVPELKNRLFEQLLQEIQMVQTEYQQKYQDI